MRLFAAMPIAEPALAEVTALLGRLRSSTWPVRWVPDEGLHLTLKFFGEVAPDRAEVIEEAVKFAGEGTGAVSMRVGELGAFPTRGRPKVLWVGLEGPPALELLQDRLERGTEAIGFPPDGGPFQPHVTLGRVREGQRCPPRWVEDYDGSFERVPFLGEELVVYESVLTTHGPRYQRRLTVDLGA
jgi:2'-5' RNA ligase